MLRSLYVVLPMVCGVVSTSIHAQTPATSDWSGAYAGGSLGLAQNVSDTRASAPLAPVNSYFTPPDDVQIAGVGDGSFSQSRLSGSIFGGFQKLYGSMLIGVEAGANSLYVDEARSRTVTYISAPTAQFTLRQAVTADWQGTLRLRLGYAQANWLAYVTGGAALTQVKVNTSLNDNFLQGGSGQGSNSETKLGWTLGLGGEYATNKNWSIRGEYLYSDFGSVDAQALVTNASSPGFSNILTSSVKFKTQVFSIGLVYRFP